MSEPRESGKVIAGRLVSWVVLSAVALAVLMIAAVFLPPRLKLLGLFSIALGLIAGWLIGQLARRCRVHYRRIVFPVALIMTSLAIAGMIAESYRLWRNAKIERLAQQADQPLAAKLFGNEAFENLPGVSIGFDDYLDQRFSALKESSPLRPMATHPRLLLGLETLLSGLAGGLVASRLVRGPFCKTCASWHESQRSVVLDPVRGNRCLKLLLEETTAAVPNDGRLELEFSSCRCSTAIPQIRCVLERPGFSPQVVGDVHPDRESYAQLTDVLDAEAGVE